MTPAPIPWRIVAGAHRKADPWDAAEEIGLIVAGTDARTVLGIEARLFTGSLEWGKARVHAGQRLTVAVALGEAWFLLVGSVTCAGYDWRGAPCTLEIAGVVDGLGRVVLDVRGGQ